MERRTFEITGKNNTLYKVEANNEEEANVIADWIDSQIDAGNPMLQGVEQTPFNAKVNPPAPAEDSSAVGSYARGGIKGFLANADDEVVGAINATDLLRGYSPGVDSLLQDLYPDQKSMFNKDTSGFWDTLDKNMANINQQKRADSAQHGTAAGLGEAGGIAGSIASGLGFERALTSLVSRIAPRAAIPTAMRLEAARLAAPAKTAAAEGAAVGGAYGAASGAAEGETLDERIQGAKSGGGLGAAGGAVLGPLVVKAAPTIKRYWDALRGANTEPQAIAQIVQALQRDGYDMSDPASANLLRSELSKYAGRDVSLADIGAATRARTGVALRSPTNVRNTVESKIDARTGQAANRLKQDVRTNVAPNTNVFEIDDNLIKSRELEAIPLRDRALFEDVPTEMPLPNMTELPQVTEEIRRLGQGLDPIIGVPAVRPEMPVATTRKSRMVDDPELLKLMTHPDAQKALGMALDQAQQEKTLLDLLGEPSDHLPDLIQTEVPDVRTLDYMKQYLDKVVNNLGRGAENVGGFTATQFNHVKNLRNALRERMKAVVPHYGDYLDKYRGISDLRDSLEKGQKYEGMAPEQIAKEVTVSDDITSGEAEFFRSGAARQMEDRLTKAGDRGAINPAKELKNTSQLEALLEPGDLAGLTKAIELETNLAKLPQELGGSQTDARRLAGQDAEAGIHANIPNPTGPSIIGNILRSVRDRTSLERNTAINEAILPRLTEQDPAVINQIIADLEQSGQRIKAEELRRRMNARTAARGFGISIGSPTGE